METGRNPTAEKLMKSFRHFRKADWRHRTVAGYKSSEVMVLFCIKRGVHTDSPGMKVSEISSRLHVTAPTVTQLINGLEANGLVERNIDPTDRRAVRINLTDQGEWVTKKAADAFHTTFNGLIDFLGEEQSNQLAELLTKAFHYFNEREASETTSQSSGDDEA